MKFSVLALDYDGTIAENGVLNPEVRAAIAEMRARGIAVILATGRILSELRRVAGDLEFVDAIVAENGAMLAFPNGQTRSLHRPPPAGFFDALRRRGIGFLAGECVVETGADCAPQVLEVIREMELPLVLQFNRSRLMILPQAASKGTGLRVALTSMRLSAHNAVAIGNAENDHDLLATCELGVAVGWGSPVLQREADQVLPGIGPAAVAPFLRQIAQETRLPPQRIGRFHLTMGTLENGQPLNVAVRGRNVLVAGEPRSGKSWVAGLACEQLILQGYCVCVVDPEGDYRTLELLPGVVVLGGDDPPPALPDLTRVLRHPDMSVVIDLSHTPYREKLDYLNSLLPMLASLRRSTGLPHRIVVDEAHYFLHEPNVRELLDLTLGAYTLVTYRLSDLHPDLRAAIEAIVVKRTVDPQEVQTLARMAGMADNGRTWKGIFEALRLNEALLLPGSQEAQGQLRKFELLPRLTAHVRHKAKYLDVNLIREQAFVFTDGGKPIGAPARTLRDFVKALRDIPLSALDGHARRGDFSRWIADVFHDHLLASGIRKIEQRYRLGQARDLYVSLAQVIQERYELPGEPFQ